MKWISAAILAVLIVVTPASAQVTTTVNKAGQQESLLNRVSDWFATAGKTREEKYVIMKNRRAARKIKQAKSALARKKKQFAR